MPAELLTLTDLGFLPQTLVLRRSLDQVAPETRLRVLAVDPRAAELLRARDDPRVTVVDAHDLEAGDPDLAGARAGRSRREWCWTLTPAFCHAALQAAPAGATLAWIDADIAFYRHPAELDHALGTASVLFVPHRYDRPFPASASPGWLADNYGALNGGTVVLRNDATGRGVAREWRERTIGWCHDRIEPERYGNQRFLEPLAALLGVRTAKSIGIGLAPWNVGRHTLSGTAGRPVADGTPAVFFHFQSLRLLARGRLPRRALPANYLVPPNRSDADVVARVSPWFRVTAEQRRLVWGPYLEQLLDEARGLGAAAHRWRRELPRLRCSQLRADWRIRLSLAAGRKRTVGG
jgi:hypothetical protein